MGKSKQSRVSQSENFIRTARELGCDVDEEAFERAVRQVAKPKPKRERDLIVEQKKQKQ